MQRDSVKNLTKYTIETSFQAGVDVTREYLEKHAPGKGTIIYEAGYRKSSHIPEVKTAHWIHDHIGGTVTVLKELEDCSAKRPDYLWNDAYWELKNPTTEKAADAAIRKALKQIEENPGGIILDYKENDFSLEKLLDVMERRICRENHFDLDILILSKDSLLKAVRYKKIRR